MGRQQHMCVFVCKNTPVHTYHADFSAYLVCVCVCLHTEQTQPLRGFPCGRVWSRVPGRATRQFSVFHRSEPSVGQQYRSHRAASLLIFIELTSLTVIGALEAEGRRRRPVTEGQMGEMGGDGDRSDSQQGCEK